MSPSPSKGGGRRCSRCGTRRIRPVFLARPVPRRGLRGGGPPGDLPEGSLDGADDGSGRASGHLPPPGGAVPARRGPTGPRVVPAAGGPVAGRGLKCGRRQDSSSRAARVRSAARLGGPIPMKTFLITGGAGFIGSNFLHHLYHHYPHYRLLVLDLLTYAGSVDNLPVNPESDDDRLQ